MITSAAPAADDATPSLTITAAAGSTVRIYDGAAQIGTATEGPAGTFTFTPTADLAQGAHTLTAVASNGFGDSAASSAQNVTIETLPPAAGILAITGKDNDADGTFTLVPSGAEAGASVVLKKSTDGGATWTTTTAAQTLAADGTVQYRALVTDAAGNSAPTAAVSASYTAPVTAGLTEADIPLTLDSNMDGTPDTIDTDDDGDGVLDNDDFAPIDAAITVAPIVTTHTAANADAGLRSNTAGAANTNYGADATVQTKGTERGLLVRFDVTAEGPITGAILNLFTSTENDPLDVYVVPNSSWTESSVTANNAPLAGMTLIGTAAAPASGKYTFTFPTTSLPTDGQPLTLLVRDPSDPSGATEALFTKETADKAAVLDISYSEVPPTLVVVSAPSTKTEFAGAEDPITLTVTLAQAPTSTVYVPLVISDPAVAAIVGDQVLVFDASNWNVAQTVSIDPNAAGDFNLIVKPLHSSDATFNAHNPEDVPGFTIEATALDISSISLAVGDHYSHMLAPVSSNGSADFTYRVVGGPDGINVVENTGELTFRPTTGQVGPASVTIEVTDSTGAVSTIEVPLTVTASAVADPAGVYVTINGGSDTAGAGTADNPFNSISYAIGQANVQGQSTVWVRGGEYTLPAIETISTAATSEITVKPLDGEHVKINFNKDNAFMFNTASRNITFEGLEIDGGTDAVDHFTILSEGFWDRSQLARGGGIIFNVDGQDITLRNNILHDAFQKGVEIADGRYVVVEGNILFNIATTSLSGGHGVMRQQAGGEFLDNDDPSKYRWELRENLIFNVEQRIYSWVQSKGYLEMALDEGKPILIDDPKDTNGVQETMKAIISNNIVAFGAIDGIRLKSTPNLTVENNSVFGNDASSGGITDKDGDTSTPTFTGFQLTGNAVQNSLANNSYEVIDAVEDAGTTGVSGNVGAGGSVRSTVTGTTPSAQILDLGDVQLFTDPENGDFTLNPALGLDASTIGVDPAVIAALAARAAAYGVTVADSGFVTDHLKNIQTILDNIPGLNDGIYNNETVFTNTGTLSADYHTLTYDVVNGPWKAATGSKPTQELRLNEAYVEWLAEINAAHSGYDRVRWGDSVIAHNQVMQDGWLFVSEIKGQHENTVMDSRGKDVNVVLNGDFLIDFEGFTPTAGQTFDLIKAGEITSANSGTLFDNVIFEGGGAFDYSLSIIEEGGIDILRLTVTGAGTGVVAQDFTRINGNTLAAGVTMAADDAMAFGYTGASIAVHDVNAAVTLDGDLILDFQQFAGTRPTSGTFDLLTANDIAGDFDAVVTLGLGAGVHAEAAVVHLANGDDALRLTFSTT